MVDIDKTIDDAKKKKKVKRTLYLVECRYLKLQAMCKKRSVAMGAMIDKLIDDFLKSVGQ